MQRHDIRDPGILKKQDSNFYPQQTWPDNPQGFIDIMQRERECKVFLIQHAFPSVTYQEADVMLMDCAFKEDEVIHRLSTRPDYLEGIRRVLGSFEQPSSPSPSTPMDSTINASTSIPNTISSTRAITPPTPIPKQAKYTNKSKKKESHHIYADKNQSTRMAGGRLALDDALRQIQSSNSPDKAYEGWSQARIRAFQMINENPNSYYYRFNAPGEEQRKGAWTQEERELFFKRLKEVGANGQWGIFSIAIPGRVGYQCSNYYRLLIQTGQVHDPNYVVDDKGKVHYLFEKRNADGAVQKTFRTHAPHQFGKKTATTTIASKKKKKKKDDGDTSGSFSVGIRKSSRLAAAGRVTRSRQQD